MDAGGRATQQQLPRPGSGKLPGSLDYSLRSPFGPPVAFNALRAYVPAFAGMMEKGRDIHVSNAAWFIVFPLFQRLP